VDVCPPTSLPICSHQLCCHGIAPPKTRTSNRIYLIVLSAAAVTVVFVWIQPLLPFLPFLLLLLAGSLLRFPLAWLIICHDCCAAEVSPRWCYDFDAGSRMAKSATANTHTPAHPSIHSAIPPPLTPHDPQPVGRRSRSCFVARRPQPRTRSRLRLTRR